MFTGLNFKWKHEHKQREAKRKSKEDSSCSLLSHFWSISRSPFFTYYIPFQSSGSQESNLNFYSLFFYFCFNFNLCIPCWIRDQEEPDMSMKAKLASMARRIEEFELRNVHTKAQPQAMPTSFEYINHPNLTTQPQPQPSMSTSSLEQAILKISKVMEDFDRKVQDSSEKLTNLDIAREKRKLPPQPHHNLQGTNAKYHGNYGENKENREKSQNRAIHTTPPHFSNCWAYFDHFPKFISCVLYLVSNLGNRIHFATVGHVFGALYGAQIMWFNLLNSKSTSHEVPLPSSLFSIQTLRTMFISVGGRVEEVTYESIQACQMMEELLGQVKARILDVYKLEFQVETRAQRSKEDSSCSLLSHFWSIFRSPFYILYTISKL
ncbi:hypothetical protein AAG906_026381 [Vitis piasezkii]